MFSLLLYILCFAHFTPVLAASFGIKDKIGGLTWKDFGITLLVIYHSKKISWFFEFFEVVI